MAVLYNADGGGRYGVTSQTMNNNLKKPATAVRIVSSLKPTPKKVTPIVRPRGPYIPGISDNVAALNSASGNVATNRIFMPTPTATGAPGIAKADSTVVPIKKEATTPTKNVDIIATPAVTTTPTGGGGGVDISNVAAAIKPELWSGTGLANHLGLVYDRAELEKAYLDAVNAKYKNLDVEFGRTQDAYYDSVASNADMLLGTLRRGDRDAAISGASSGSQAATQLSALLGIGQQNAQGATELAQGRGDLVTKRETEVADSKNKALKDYNDLGLTLGERISSIYNADMVGYSADQAANASTIAAQLAREASNYAADQGLKGANAAANASIAASKNYNPAANVDPNVAKNQEIANLMAALNAPGIDDKTRKAIQDKLNRMLGVAVPAAPKRKMTNVDAFGKFGDSNKLWIPGGP